MVERSRSSTSPALRWLLLGTATLLGVGGCRSIAAYDPASSDTALEVDGRPADGGVSFGDGAADSHTPSPDLGDCAKPEDCPLRKCAFYPECKAGRCVYKVLSTSPQATCRKAAGPCDEPERCDGQHPDCPADTGDPPPTITTLNMVTFTIIKSGGYVTEQDEVIARCDQSAGQLSEARGILVADLSGLGSRRIIAATLRGCRKKVDGNVEAELYAAGIANPPTNSDFDAETFALLQRFLVSTQNLWEIQVAPTLLDKSHVGFLLKLDQSGCLCTKPRGCDARQHVFAGGSGAVPGACQANDWKLAITSCP